MEKGIKKDFRFFNLFDFLLRRIGEKKKAFLLLFILNFNNNNNNNLFSYLTKIKFPLKTKNI